MNLAQQFQGLKKLPVVGPERTGVCQVLVNELPGHRSLTRRWQLFGNPNLMVADDERRVQVGDRWVGHFPHFPTSRLTQGTRTLQFSTPTKKKGCHPKRMAANRLGLELIYVTKPRYVLADEGPHSGGS